MLEELKKIGLSENEAKVYLALLELGSATAQEIAQKSGVNRPTTYVQLDSLIKMGLVSSFEKAPANKKRKPKTFFRIEDPEYLKRLVSREKLQVQEREVVLKDILPELGRLFAVAGERPRVRFFEGKEGLITMREEFLKTKDKEIEVITSADAIQEVFSEKERRDYMQRRAQKGIKVREIYTRKMGKSMTPIRPLTESRFIPENLFPVNSHIIIYSNNIAIAAMKGKLIGVVIESQEIAKSMRSIFNLAWQAAEKYNK
jgi:sugar-specific transcriptional regulator TrmB